MRHILQRNIVLNIPKQAIKGFNHIFVGNSPCDKNFIDSAGQFGAGNAFPLYLYPESNAQQTIGQTTPVFDHPSKGEFRTPNLNMVIVKQLAEKLSLTFVPEKEPEGNVCFINNPEVRPDFRTTFAPIDILDYIYAVLHSPVYREKYKEFLKIDFPRVPYPKDSESFWNLVELGGELRQIHLLESPKVNQFITSYPVDGDNTVVKPRFLNSAPVAQHESPRPPLRRRMNHPAFQAPLQRRGIWWQIPLLWRGGRRPGWSKPMIKSFLLKRQKSN